MGTTINLYFYNNHRELSIGDTVTVAKVFLGEAFGERARLEKVTARYAEFVTTSGSRVKVYAQGSLYLGHYLPTGWRNDGWFIDTDPNREITEQHPVYSVYSEKTHNYEKRDK